jgi:hypothetical protein
MEDDLKKMKWKTTLKRLNGIQPQKKIEDNLNKKWKMTSKKYNTTSTEN